MLSEEIKSSEGREIKEFLMAHLNSMLDIRNVKDCKTDKAQAIEFKAQKKAFNKLSDILSKWIDLEGKKEDTGTDDYSFR